MAPPSIWAVFVLLLCGCQPTLDWRLVTPNEDPELGYGVGIGEGDCGGQPAPIYLQRVDPAEPVMPDFPALAPGAHCFEAIAFRHRDEPDPDTNGVLCRTEALSRQTRDLPADREPLVSELPVDAPPPRADGLLRAVAGCNPSCDVDRCVCSRGCDPACLDEEGCACPEPVRARDLVITDHFACSLASNRAGLSCWGDGMGGPVADPSLPGGGAPLDFRARLAAARGVAQDFPLAALVGTEERLLTLGMEEPGEARIQAIDAEGDRLCFTSGLFYKCVEGASVDQEFGLTAPSRIVVAGDVTCVGETDAICFDRQAMAAPRTSSRLGNTGPFDGVSELVGAGDFVCGIVGGVLRCASEERACTNGCPDGGPCACDALSQCVLRTCRPADIAPLGFSASSSGLLLFQLSAGWGRVCGVTSARQVHCLTLNASQAEPPRMPFVRLQDGAVARALDVAVGESHLCLQQEQGDVACAPFEVDPSDPNALHLGALVPFPVENVDVFVAGPRGITCAIRSDDAQVVCDQLPGFAEPGAPPDPLLGVAHSRVVGPPPPVCP